MWIRDNATVDPSGHHTLSNIANLDSISVPTPGEFWKSPEIRFTTSDGTPTKNPVGGQMNNVIVKVKNFGTILLNEITLEAFWANAAASLPTFPSPGWNPLGTIKVSNINPGEAREGAALAWTPSAPGPGQDNHFCVFVRTTASVGPLDPINYSFTHTVDLARHNTNVSHRNVVILSSPQPPPSGPFPVFFTKFPIRFFVTNISDEGKFTELRVKGLPVEARAMQLGLEVKPKDQIEVTGLEAIDSRVVITRPEIGSLAPSTTVPQINMARFAISDMEKISLTR